MLRQWLGIICPLIDIGFNLSENLGKAAALPALPLVTPLYLDIGMSEGPEIWGRLVIGGPNLLVSDFAVCLRNDSLCEIRIESIKLFNLLFQKSPETMQIVMPYQKIIGRLASLVENSI